MGWVQRGPRHPPRRERGRDRTSARRGTPVSTRPVRQPETSEGAGVSGEHEGSTGSAARSCGRRHLDADGGKLRSFRIVGLLTAIVWGARRRGFDQSRRADGDGRWQQACCGDRLHPSLCERAMGGNGFGDGGLGEARHRADDQCRDILDRGHPGAARGAQRPGLHRRGLPQPQRRLGAGGLRSAGTEDGRAVGHDRRGPHLAEPRAATSRLPTRDSPSGPGATA